MAFPPDPCNTTVIFALYLQVETGGRQTQRVTRPFGTQFLAACSIHYFGGFAYT